MPPNTKDFTGVLNEEDVVFTENIPKERLEIKPRKYIIVWRNVTLYGLIHVIGLYGLYLSFTSAKLASTAFGKFFFL